MMTSNQNSTIEQEPVRPVNQSIQEYRVIEDGALAYHLQEREIEHHYACNVENRRTVMQDIRTAQQLQDEEDVKARILTLEEQAEREKMDELLAEAYQEKLFKKHLEDERLRKEWEERDNELAFMMMERERRNERRRQAVDRDLADRLSRMPTATMERMKKMSDQELAERLQAEEERKARRKESERNSMKAVVEMQDEELARYIHEREMESDMMARRDKHKRKSQKSTRHREEDQRRHREEDQRRHREEDQRRHREEDQRRHREEDQRRHREEDQRRHREEDQRRHREEDQRRHREEDQRRHREEDQRRHREEDQRRHQEEDQRRHREEDQLKNGENKRTSSQNPSYSASHHRKNVDMKDATRNIPDRSPRQEETTPKSIHTTTPRKQTKAEDAVESPHRRTKSERPRRPPQPSRDHHASARRYSDKSLDVSASQQDQISTRDARDDKLRPTSDAARHPAVDPDISEDIPYSERFARLAAQESWNYDQVPTEHMRKKKGDCKQQ